MGKTVTWLKEQARLKQVYICGSIIIEENGRYFNRFLWVSPNGVVTAYDKRHLFRMAGEHNHYSAGSDRVQLRINDIQLRPQVCYDLRFPEMYVKLVQEMGAEVLLMPSAFTVPTGKAHWHALLRGE